MSIAMLAASPLCRLVAGHTPRSTAAVARASTSSSSSSFFSNRTSFTTTTSSSRRFDAMVFDLDGVLYPADNGYMEHVRSNARRFIVERYGRGSHFQPNVIGHP